MIGLSYSNVYSLWQDLSHGTVIFYFVTLTLKLLLKNFNLGHNFLIRSDRAFILHMCIPCDKTFHLVPKFLTPWPWSLTYFWKTLTLAITFLPEVRGLSFCICIFLVIRPFTWYRKFWPCDLHLEVWPTFEKLKSRLLFSDGCRPSSVVVFWQLLFVESDDKSRDLSLWCFKSHDQSNFETRPLKNIYSCFL